MYNTVKNQEKLIFKHFSNKGYSLFAALGKEVLIGVLAIPMLSSAQAAEGKAMDNETMHADSLVHNGKDIGEVVVTASRAPLTLAQQARTVTVLTQRDIAALPAQSINDLLKYAAGVDVRQRGPIGAQTDVSVRGGNDEQVAILLNGISISDPQTGHNAFDIPVNPSDIERIEVLEGPAARVYGTSSLLGAINIVTKKNLSSDRISTSASPSATQWQADGYLEGGSHGYLSAGARAAVANSQWQHSLSTGYSRSDGYTRSKGGHLSTDYSGLHSFYQGSYSDPNVIVSWHAGLSTRGWGSSTFYSKNFDNQYEHTFKSFTAIQAETRQGRIHLRPAIYWNHQYDRFELFRGDDAVTGMTLANGNTLKIPFNYHRADIFGANLNSWFDWALGRTAMGLELRNEDLVSTNLGEALHKAKPIHGTDRYYRYGLDRTNIQLALEHNIFLGPLTVSGGIIAVKNSWADMPMKVYPSADLSLQLSPVWKLYASYNSSLRMPSVTELYYSVGGFKADAHLQPEELNAFEAGMKMTANGISGNMSAFYNHYKNLIDWIVDGTKDENGNLVAKSVNFGKINAYGFEGTIAFDFLRLIPSQHVLRSFTTSYCYIQQSEEQNEGITSNYVLEYLKHKWVSQLGLNLCRKLSLDISYRLHHRMGAYRDTAGELQRYGTYGLLDAKLSWNERSWSAYVEGNNLFDKNYEEVGNVPQPGIWIIGGVKIKL
ncbi:MAG: TonB-dependent receptor [Prevotella sp.]|nr:TonB-dependent receptor [Prevotella sp.]